MTDNFLPFKMQPQDAVLQGGFIGTFPAQGDKTMYSYGLVYW
jgi:hypothetical protein